MAFDIRWACDVLRPVFDRTDGKDGRVSIEVDPRLAHDTERTTAEAKALWWLVDRPNVMIKIPATEEGLPSITAATAAGHQRQRHADLRPRPLRRGHGRLPHRPRAGQGRTASTCRRSTRSRRSSCPASTPRSTSGWTRSARDEAQGAARQGRHRERPAGLRALREGRRVRPVEGARRGRREHPAPAVGLDRRQGPGLRRHDVRRRAGRARTP